MPITPKLGIEHRLIWTRSLWMRLATFSVSGAAMVLLIVPTDALELRQAAQIQFMHAMGIFACATFMNIGAHRAKHAPLCFIFGSVLHCGPTYVAHAGGTVVSPAIAILGTAILACGWLVLIAAAGSIDRTLH
jgi:uncharacterized membrane protein YgdD (TMEM256/DUF423 family)